MGENASNIYGVKIGYVKSRGFFISSYLFVIIEVMLRVEERIKQCCLRFLYSCLIFYDMNRFYNKIKGSFRAKEKKKKSG
jgi:hypothetical protein